MQCGMSILTHVRTHTHARTHTHMRMHMRSYTHTHTHTHAPTHARTFSLSLSRTHIHLYMHIAVVVVFCCFYVHSNTIESFRFDVLESKRYLQSTFCKKCLQIYVALLKNLALQNTSNNKKLILTFEKKSVC